ncbi:MAG: hypothetical protein DCC54_11910 [Anaerolineae bacterium]|nr:MAG: hypothetical protein DCC54_11910 [Anaerolineae bacterium]
MFRPRVDSLPRWRASLPLRFAADLARGRGFLRADRLFERAPRRDPRADRGDASQPDAFRDSALRRVHLPDGLALHADGGADRPRRRGDQPLLVQRRARQRLIFWEVMTLASYFLVVWEFDKKESAKTGFIYFLVAHIGAALIMVTFFLFFGETNTFNFAGIRAATLPPVVKDIAFVLAFLGFGAKAGMVPLHFWTPDTYAAAPNHVSALMASVMKKTAVYGILRFCVDLLGGSVLWWGFTVLTFGALSTVFGAFYALSEKDIKRLLAASRSRSRRWR